MTQPRIDLLRTRVTRLDEAESGEIQAVFRALETEALQRFQVSEAGGMRLVLSADMRYVGQEHTARVEIASASTPREVIEREFHAAHRRAYTFDLPGEEVELVTFHLAAYRLVSRPELTPLDTDGRAAEIARKGKRSIDFDREGVQECVVYERDRLPPGFRASGPLIVEEPASTTLVNPGQGLEVDRFGNLIIRTG